MEAKLKEYRTLRRRKEILETTKDSIKTTRSKLVDFLTPKFIKMQKEKKQEEEVLLLEDEDPVDEIPYIEEPEPVKQEFTPVVEEECTEEIQEESWRYCLTKWAIYMVIWFTLYIIFLSFQFGAVYFVVTALLGVYFNTRTRPKKKGEVSAYSVFNPDCKSIDGTLTAEQLQRQMLYGPLGIGL